MSVRHASLLCALWRVVIGDSSLSRLASGMCCTWREDCHSGVMMTFLWSSLDVAPHFTNAQCGPNVLVAKQSSSNKIRMRLAMARDCEDH